MKISKKAKGLLITITAIVAVVLITLSLCLYFMLFVYGAYQPYSNEQRQILLQNFDNVDFTSDNHVSLKRYVGSFQPINFIKYNGDPDGLTALWQSLPSEVRGYSAIIISSDDVLRPGRADALSNTDKLLKVCTDNSIPFAAEIITGESQHEWLLPLAYVEQKFLSDKNCIGVSVNKIYSASKSRGLLDGNFSNYIADLILLCAKYGEYLIWSDCNVYGENGIIIDWIETNEYLYTAMMENSSNVIMMADGTEYARSTYSLMLGLYLSGLIGNWGVTGDLSDLHDAAAVNTTKRSSRNDVGNTYCDSFVLAAAYGATSFLINSSDDVVNMDNNAFKYGMMPFIRSINNGGFRVPDKADVFDKIKFAVVGGRNFKEVDRDNGSIPVSNYGIIPLLPKNIRSNARRSFTDNKVQLIEIEFTADIAANYINADVAGTAYLGRTGKKWFYISNSDSKHNLNAAKVNKFYNCGVSELSIVTNVNTYAMIVEDAASLKFTVNNYHGSAVAASDAAVETNLIKTIIKITIAEGDTPTVTFAENNDYTAYYTQNVNIVNNVAEITIMHNGRVEFTVTTGTPQSLEPPEKKEVNNATYDRNNSGDYDGCNAVIGSIDTLLANRTAYTNVGIGNLLEYRYLLSRTVQEQDLADADIKALIAEFREHRDLLIEITEQVRMLRLYQNTGDAKLDKAFDILMRELLSPTDYVEGKENGNQLGFPYSKNVFDQYLRKIKISEITKAQKTLHSELLEKGLYTA